MFRDVENPRSALAGIPSALVRAAAWLLIASKGVLGLGSPAAAKERFASEKTKKERMTSPNTQV